MSDIARVYFAFSYNKEVCKKVFGFVKASGYEGHLFCTY